MLRLNLQPIFTARGIDKPYTFLVKAGFTAHSAHIILTSKVRLIKLDYMEILCEKLNCEPNDLLLWTPDKNRPILESHPLFNLSNRNEVGTNPPTTLRDIPYKQLREITSKLAADSGQSNV